MAVADPLESTPGDEFPVCTILIVSQMVTLALGQLGEEIFLDLANLVNNGVTKRSEPDKPVIAFRMFESMVTGLTFHLIAWLMQGALYLISTVLQGIQ